MRYIWVDVSPLVLLTLQSKLGSITSYAVSQILVNSSTHYMSPQKIIVDKAYHQLDTERQWGLLGYQGMSKGVYWSQLKFQVLANQRLGWESWKGHRKWCQGLQLWKQDRSWSQAGCRCWQWVTKELRVEVSCHVWNWGYAELLSVGFVSIHCFTVHQKECEMIFWREKVFPDLSSDSPPKSHRRREPVYGVRIHMLSSD